MEKQKALDDNDVTLDIQHNAAMMYTRGRASVISGKATHLTKTDNCMNSRGIFVNTIPFIAMLNLRSQKF